MTTLAAHAYGPHDPTTVPATVTVGAGRHEREMPYPAALAKQRAQLNALAASGHPTKAQVLDAVNRSAPQSVKDRIDAAIMAVARRGVAFSANDFRDMFPESGGIVGSRVSALAKREEWEHVAYVASTKANTHGHEIKVWRVRSAVAA